MASQESISMLTDILGIPNTQAATLLQKHNNNADHAMNDYLDNGERALQYHPPQEKWQETDNLPSFRIDLDETANSSIRAAPSRPPSRVSFGAAEPIDLSAAHAAADSSKVLSLQEEEEIDEQRYNEALKTSRLEYEQENGVTGMGQQFGPATGSYYQPDKWAIVPSTANHVVREVFEHPRPSKRRRISNEPVFLRGSKETGSLAPLLTIYHSIPLARQALLFPALEVHAYGYDPSWWNGTSDENDKSVSVENPNIDKDRSNLICEIQCLMAFLDCSNRAYGSVDALADLRAYKAPEIGDPASLVLDEWKQAAMEHSPDEQLTQVFNSFAVKAGHPPFVRHFSFLDPPVQRSLAEMDVSIYDILDDAIWNDKFDSELENICVGHCAEIFTMRLRDPLNAKAGLQIKIPAIWYSDRYLEECENITWAMRATRQALYHEVNRLGLIQQKYQLVTTNGGKELNVQVTLDAAKQATAIAVKDKVLPNGVQDDMQPLLSNPLTISQAQLQDCQADLQNVLDRIDRKLKQLSWKIDECREQYRLCGQVLTQKSNDPSQPPHHRYFLQGITTLPHVTYVRRKIEEDLIDLDDDKVEDHDEKPAWQWWRISFSKDDAAADEVPVAGPVTEAEARSAQMASQQGTVSSNLARKIRPAGDSADVVGYSIRKVREYEVLKAAREESGQVVLVYAAEAALNFQGEEASSPLKAFVNTDNQTFASELAADADPPPAYQHDAAADAEVEPEEMDADADTEIHMDVDVDVDVEDDSPAPEMQQRSNGSGGGNALLMSKIGQHSEDLLSRVEANEADEGVRGGAGADSDATETETEAGTEVVHIEHSMTPMR